jgi:hypothetical protein
VPYVLAYAYRIVETVCADISPTCPVYLEEVERRLAAHVLIWGTTLLDETYASGPLLNFVLKHREWLFEHCKASGYRTPNFKDLVRMQATGAFPGGIPLECLEADASLSGGGGSVWQRDTDVAHAPAPRVRAQHTHQSVNSDSAA